MSGASTTALCATFPSGTQVWAFARRIFISKDTQKTLPRFCDLNRAISPNLAGALGSAEGTAEPYTTAVNTSGVEES